MKKRIVIRSDYRAKSPLKFRVVNKCIYEVDHAVGQCWPFTRKHVIEIDPRQPPKDYLDTLIHETLHILLPRKREDFILKAGTSIADLLWRLGYRKSYKVKKRS